MRHLFLFSALLCASWTSLAGADLKLTPYPQVVTQQPGELALSSPVRIALRAASEEDRFAAGMLREELKTIAHADSIIGAQAGKGPGILIGRLGEPAVGRVLARLKVDRAALEKPESYVLHVGSNGILVAAKTSEGIFYAVQTLRQLIPRVSSGPIRLPYLTITDWPALRYRGLSVDISRGPIPTEEQMRSMIRTMSEYKMNLISYYMEHVYTYSHAPIVPPEGGEITPELMKRIIAYARNYHMDVVPQQQTFGHLHHVLKFERYQDMAEVPHGNVLAANSPEAYEWVRKSATQLANEFSSKFLHIGSDETTELGEGRSRADTQRLGAGAVYFDHMSKVVDMLRPLNKTLMFWGDIALNHPELLPKLPKDLVAMTWGYEPKEDFSAHITPFRNQRIDVFVCPGLSDWNRIYPNFTVATKNINNFVRDGKKLGAIGMLNTDWRDSGEGLFNLAWYGIVFSAAAAWQSGDVEVPAFDRSFDWAFYRSNGDTFVQAIRKLDQIHGLLDSTGVGDAGYELFWIDPFSQSGAVTVRKAVGVASEARRLAEDAWMDLAAHAGDAAAHQDTLPFLRLAARRLDYMGMKLQYSCEVADGYREQKNYGAGYRVQDLTEYVNELKGAYRTLWLSENRPYWIDNVLLRYDHEALYWLQKRRIFAAAERRREREGTLASPESLGVVLP